MEAHGLDKVIEKLKEKGIQAGEAESEKMKAEAQKKAEKIIDEAKEEAEEIVKKAKKEAESITHQMQAELKNASQVALSAFRQSMERGFLLPEVDSSLKPVISKADFMEKTISELIKAFAEKGFEEGGIQVLLPEERRKELEAAFVQKLKMRSSTKVEVEFDDNITYGFQIGPADGRFVLDFSEAGFREILMRFMSPRFREYFEAGKESGSKEKKGKQ